MVALSIDEEKVLLAALQLGDVKAFEQIYAAYGRAIALKLHQLIRIPEQVEEIHQDVFTALWVQRERVEEISSLRGYLYTIVKRKVIDFYRKASRDKALQEELIYFISSSYEHIESLLEDKENKDLLETLVSQLPAQRQKVFRMVKIDGKSYSEAAAHFQVSMSTIKDHMARSSEFFKKQLEGKYSHLLCVLLLNLYLN